MIMNVPKTGLLYTQRTIQPIDNLIRTEDRIERFLEVSNIKLIKKYSDIGYENLMRPGLNGLLNFLANTEETIDIAVFYSFDPSGRGQRRIQFVMPRIKKTVKDVMFIRNFSDRSVRYDEPLKGNKEMF
ncbi:hypothetical protein [Oceanobacillus damuensis]|uniref:hypothetical protein n=1 Tax=Oceanobacillus damuensis TaxID=937928 RepID=UPI00082A740B|nr:hypothetical protein [Oceanobacillus damuensis]